MLLIKFQNCSQKWSLAYFAWFFASISSIIWSKPILAAHLISINSYIGWTKIAVFVLAWTYLAWFLATIPSSLRDEPFLFTYPISIYSYIWWTKLVVLILASFFNFCAYSLWFISIWIISTFLWIYLFIFNNYFWITYQSCSPLHDYLYDLFHFQYDWTHKEIRR